MMPTKPIALLTVFEKEVLAKLQVTGKLTWRLQDWAHNAALKRLEKKGFIIKVEEGPREAHYWTAKEI